MSHNAVSAQIGRVGTWQLEPRRHVTERAAFTFLPERFSPEPSDHQHPKLNTTVFHYL